MPVKVRDISPMTSPTRYDPVKTQHSNPEPVIDHRTRLQAKGASDGFCDHVQQYSNNHVDSRHPELCWLPLMRRRRVHRGGRHSGV